MLNESYAYALVSLMIEKGYESITARTSSIAPMSAAPRSTRISPISKRS